jgi:hypothetical protein
MNLIQEKNFEYLRRYTVLGSRRWSNYCWASLIFLGGIGFLLTGISSYLGFNILPFLKAETIIFFPQGLVMCFYGFLGLLFSVYLWLTIFWNVGEGFNEFNKKDELVRIFRWGFPGKNRRIDLSYSLNDIQCIRVEIQEGLNPRRTIYMRVKGNRDIPLTRVGQPMTLEQIEKQAAELAKFLQVSLEGV